MKIKAVLLIAFFVCGCIAALKLGVVGGKSAGQPQTLVSTVPVTGQAAAFAMSAKISAYRKAAADRDSKQFTVSDRPGNKPADNYPAGQAHDTDDALARPSALSMPTPALAFDALANYDNIAAYSLVILPPDMIGDVGPSHYVQIVNALLRVYDKSGAPPLTPPTPLASLFAPLGTACSTRNDGEPNVLYDPLADRWLISQYCNAFPPFRQMIAISKTADPTGDYFLYEFVMPNIRLNDFAKFGVWPDGYYMSTEEFIGSDYAGMGMFAFDRAKMLVGDHTAGLVYFNRPSLSTARIGNFLPSDLDGLRPPPQGAPNTFISYTATEYGQAQDALRLFDFHVDFVHPLNSTFTERPESPLVVTAFDPTSPDGRQDIAQPAPGEFLDSNSDRLNYRAAYRNLGTSESLVVNQTVRAGETPYRAGVRIYELRRSGAAYTVNVQSTIGDASMSRWVGSAAADNQGNIAAGYNTVADDKKPSIRYTGRLATDPVGTLRDEGTLVDGTGVQKAFGWRWGDYSGMTVDPVDDCTFWMTGEYFSLESEQFSDYTWLTRVGKFKFPECTATPRASMTGSVTNISNGQPIEGALIATGVYSRRSSTTGSYGNLYLLPGGYTVTVSAKGFRTQTMVLSLADGQTFTQNFAMQPVAVIENTATQVTAESCGLNGAPDPGENVTLNIPLRNTGSLNAQNLTATLLATGGVTNPGPAQNYGALAVGGASVSRPFTFTVSPATLCGAEITLTLHLQDGAEDLGNLNIVLGTGKAKVAFQQNFDRSQQLPPRWTRSESHNNEFELPSERNWRASMKRSTSGPKAAFSPDINQIGVNEMVSPVFVITTPTARLTFQNWYELETTFLRNRLYDGSVLEIRIGNGAWQDIIAAGGTFESGGYDGTIDSCCSNPLAAHQGWSGRSGINQVSEFITTAVRLPATAAGNQVQLRWRVGTDVGTFREGQYVDDVLITDGFVCGCSAGR